MVSAHTPTLASSPLSATKRRQVHAVEGHVEAAHEEADHEQQVARVREGLLEGLAQGLLVDQAGRGGLAAERPGQAAGRAVMVPASTSRLALPAEQVHEQVRVGEGDEAADAARHAERGDGGGALVGRRGASGGAHQRRDAGAADADAEQHAAQHQVERRARGVHDIEAGHRSPGCRPPPRGPRRSGRRSCRRTPRRCPRSGWRPPWRSRTARRPMPSVARHGRQVEAHDLAHAHGNADDQAGRQHDDPERARRCWRRRHVFLHGCFFLSDSLNHIGIGGAVTDHGVLQQARFSQINHDACACVASWVSADGGNCAGLVSRINSRICTAGRGQIQEC